MIHKVILILTLTAVGTGISIGEVDGASSSGWITTRARHLDLVLVLRGRTDGQQVRAVARLTNKGSAAFAYWGGCVPPEVQIQARDATGAHVYGWEPPQVQCFARTPRELQPGKTLTARATFSIDSSVSLYALVPQTPTIALFSTHRIHLSV